MMAIVCALFTVMGLIRHIPWRKLAVILITFLIVSWFGVRIVASVDNLMLKRILGGILIGVSLYFFLVNGRIHLKPTVPVQMGMGAISGMMGGLFGMQGPPAVIYFISCTDRKEEYMAITQWYFIIGNLMMTFYRAGNGFLTAPVLKTFALTFPAVFLGLFTGSRVYRKLNIETIRRCVYVFIGVAGVVALVS